jgi:glutathione S-transferase
MMKLYYAPGACSLAAHIVLRELALPFRLVAVSLKRRTTADGEDFLAVNPKGYVPVLGLDDGSLLTEGPAILQYLADRRPELGLAPPNGTLPRYRLQEWLAFINSEVHKAFGPLFDPAAPQDAAARARATLVRRLDYVAGAFAGPHLAGEAFTVADAYLYTVLTWTAHVGPDLAAWPVLGEYLARLATRPSIRDAHAAERSR